MARRHSVLVLSKIGGLRAAFDAASLASKASAIDLTWAAEVSADAIDDALATADVVVGEPSAETVAMLPRASQLRWFQSTFAGCNSMLALPESHRGRFAVTRLAGTFGPDIGEYAALHVLALERGLALNAARQAEASWPDDATRRASYRRLSSLTLGILGFGDIGRGICDRLGPRGLGMRVVGLRRGGGEADDDVAAVYAPSALSSFLTECDYMVSVLPETEETRGLLNGDALAPCTPRSAVLINAGRGSLIDEAHIIRALDLGYIRHYVGDVFPVEPLPPSSALWSHERVTVTPHVAAVTTPSDVAHCFGANLERFVAGEPLAHTFDWERSY